MMHTHSTIVFYDDAGTEMVSGLHLEPVPVEKLGAILDRGQPSDLGGVSTFAGSVVTADHGTFRMYYYCNSPYGQGNLKRIAIAESSDGLDWRRPELGQATWEGQACNHIAVKGLSPDANITQPSVVRLPDGRWRMYFWLHGQERGMVRYLIADSEDGLVWTLLDLNRPALFHPADLEVGQAGWTAGLTNADPKARFDDRRTWAFLDAKRLRSNDATNVYWDPERERFDMLSVWLLPNGADSGRRTPHDNAPGVLRVIHRRTSADGIHFSDPELIVVPDAADPRTQQFYYLSQHREPGWRIGFLGNYHCWEQTMDLELCFSRDGRRWLRPLRGGFIPRDPAPECGCMSAYATNNLLPIAGERWLMLYRAGNTQHNHQLGPGVTEPWYGVMGAAWPQGRFAGLATAPNTIGRFLLRPFVQTQEQLSVNADVKGWLKAELRDPIGTCLPGFELSRCRQLRGNRRQLVLRWGEDGHTSSAYRYDAVQLYVQVCDGIIYGVNA